MPTTVKVIQAKDFVRATHEGHADIEEAERLLRAMAEAGAGREDFQVLVDTRRSTGAISATQLWSLTQKLAQYRHAFGRKTAILCPHERFDHNRFFALCAENRGFNVRAFVSYEEAMEWLIE